MSEKPFIHRKEEIRLPEAGDLLLAEPMMTDPYFGRGAILILDAPPQGGHLGLLMNKRTSVSLGELIPDWQAGKEIPVFCGGPVDMERLFMIHTLGDILKDSTEIKPGLYVGANLDDVVEYVESGGIVEGKMRFFMGYCGWSPRQLLQEMKNHTWVVSNHRDNDDILSGDGTEYWRNEVKFLGDEFRSWLIVPPDPSYN